jgi:hypothetical protein
VCNLPQYLNSSSLNVNSQHNDLPYENCGNRKYSYLRILRISCGIILLRALTSKLCWDPLIHRFLHCTMPLHSVLLASFHHLSCWHLASSSATDVDHRAKVLYRCRPLSYRCYSLRSGHRLMFLFHES